MSTVRKVIITTVVVAIVGLGGWWLIASMSANDKNDSSSGTTNDQEQGESADENAEAAATITYTGEAFAPAMITVKAGDTIKIVNDGENTMYFASDEHPTHLDNSELNVGDVEPGSSATFTITSSGTWGYHDHYNASAGGEIIVE